MAGFAVRWWLRLRPLGVRQANQVGDADHARNASSRRIRRRSFDRAGPQFRKPSPSRSRRRRSADPEEPPDPNRARSKRALAHLRSASASRPPPASKHSWIFTMRAARRSVSTSAARSSDADQAIARQLSGILAGSSTGGPKRLGQICGRGSDSASPNTVSSTSIALPRQTTLRPVQAGRTAQRQQEVANDQADGIRHDSGQPAAKARMASAPYQKAAVTRRRKRGSPRSPARRRRPPPG